MSFFSARAFTLMKNCITGDVPSGGACSPSGIRFNRMTEYRVMALITCRGPCAKTTRVHATHG